jgi:hypothetical protein
MSKSKLAVLGVFLLAAIACTFTLAPPTPAPLKPLPSDDLIFNIPTPNADAVHFPDDVRDDMPVCVQIPFTTTFACEPLKELRQQLLTRKAV